MSVLWGHYSRSKETRQLKPAAMQTRTGLEAGSLHPGPATPVRGSAVTRLPSLRAHLCFLLL